MYKDSLFELIRQEEVILFVGAGLSLYAGYPNGNELKKKLFESLSEMEKSEMDFNLSLNEFTEEFYRIKGNNRNKLIKILNDCFINFQPKSTLYHDKLALVSHFKTIITTNYDRLFENSYGDNCKIVFSSKQIPYLENDKTTIFKIHGDLQDPDSIIITKSDYNNFFKNSRENEIFWTVVKERFCTKSVLFLGYNLEDPNVSVVFDKIADELKTNRKECFLIVPSLPQHKINDLISKKIHYLDIKGEEFIDDLIENIKENIINDFDKNYISTDTFGVFLNNFNLLPQLKSKSNSFELTGITGKYGSISGDVKLKFKDDNDVSNKFNQIINGKIIGEIELTQDKLESLEIRLEGLKMSNKKTNLMLKSSPKGNFIVDIEFENGFEICKIPLKIYGGKDFVEVHFELENVLLKVKIFLSQEEPIFNVNLEYKNNFQRIRSGIKLFTFLENFGLANKYKIITANNELKKIDFLPVIPQLVEQAKMYKKYFEDLDIIQSHYKITFSDFSFESITNDNFNIVDRIMSIINKQIIVSRQESDIICGYNSKINSKKFKLIDDVSNSKINFEVFLKKEEIIDLHNQKINLGYKKIEILDSIIVNLEEIKNNNKVKNIVIRSLSEKIMITYLEKLN